jgi:hypothetical protein
MSETEPRDVYEVCDKILILVPDTEDELIYQLMQFRETLWNQAPELRKSSIFWKPLTNILEKNIKSFNEEWQRNVLKLFNGE